jgi:hypothetical protein
MAKRTGIPTLLWVAKRLCQLVADYGSVITALYPSNAALIAALAAANAACSTLAAELEMVRDYGT